MIIRDFAFCPMGHISLSPNFIDTNSFSITRNQQTTCDVCGQLLEDLPGSMAFAEAIIKILSSPDIQQESFFKINDELGEIFENGKSEPDMIDSLRERQELVKYADYVAQNIQKDWPTTMVILNNIDSLFRIFPPGQRNVDNLIKIINEMNRGMQGPPPPTPN